MFRLSYFDNAISNFSFNESQKDKITLFDTEARKILNDPPYKINPYHFIKSHTPEYIHKREETSVENTEKNAKLYLNEFDNADYKDKIKEPPLRNNHEMDLNYLFKRYPKYELKEYHQIPGITKQQKSHTELEKDVIGTMEDGPNYIEHKENKIDIGGLHQRYEQERKIRRAEYYNPELKEYRENERDRDEKEMEKRESKGMESNETIRQPYNIRSSINNNNSTPAQLKTQNKEIKNMESNDIKKPTSTLKNNILQDIKNNVELKNENNTEPIIEKNENTEPIIEKRRRGRPKNTDADKIISSLSNKDKRAERKTPTKMIINSVDLETPQKHKSSDNFKSPIVTPNNEGVIKKAVSEVRKNESELKKEREQREAEFIETKKGLSKIGKEMYMKEQEEAQLIEKNKKQQREAELIEGMKKQQEEEIEIKTRQPRKMTVEEIEEKEDDDKIDELTYKGWTTKEVTKYISDLYILQQTYDNDYLSIIFHLVKDLKAGDNPNNLLSKINLELLYECQKKAGINPGGQKTKTTLINAVKLKRQQINDDKFLRVHKQTSINLEHSTKKPKKSSL